MNTRNRGRIKVLFSNFHDELLSDKEEAAYPISSLLHLLVTELKYTPEFPLEFFDNSAQQFLSSAMLAEYDIVVLGAPTTDVATSEYKALRTFLKQGGSLLLLCNSNMLMDELPRLERLTKRLGIELHEYHNTQPGVIDVFSPHAITAGVAHLCVTNIAALIPTGEARAVAYVEVTREPEIIREAVAACADLRNNQHPEGGRFAVIGDVAFCSDDLLVKNKGNKRFILNTFQWLARRNPLDITVFAATEIVQLGETGQVNATLSHSNPDKEPHVECLLESAQEAIIEPLRRGRLVTAVNPVSMSWKVTPEHLGKQGLQLVVKIEKKDRIRFTLLPDMQCLAPGHLRLDILDAQGKSKLTFEKGDVFTVKGIFHASIPSQHVPSMKLECYCYEGLAYGEPFSPETGIWNLTATEPGTHRITLSIPETGQTASAFVTVKPTKRDRRAELYIAYVNPLDVEIAGRLKHVDPRFCEPAVKDAPFEIALLDEYIERLYKEPSRKWLQQLLTAVKREKNKHWELIDQFMTYFLPTYQPSYGKSFIPYDPALVSALTRIYPSERKRLEYNFLCSEETREIDIKRHIAAYLLHEKYGHGFFYTQTLLGQQLSILEQFGFPEEPKSHAKYQEVAGMIEDSSIVVNEGFGAWMEITFLKRLIDDQVREAAKDRHEFLILEATGFLQKSVYRDFFEHFPPRYDSKYREGYEYFDFIATNYNVRCAIRALMIATHIDFGISRHEETKEIAFRYTPEEMNAFFERQAGSKDERPLRWLSHLRLRMITDLLYEFKDDLELPVRRQYCLPVVDERTSSLNTLITEDLKRRRSVL